MVFPKDGKFICKNCGEEVEPEIVEMDGSVNTKAETRELRVDDEKNVATLPKTRIMCDKCGNTEAYYYMRQNRSADEPETIFYRCTKCNYKWSV